MDIIIIILSVLASILTLLLIIAFFKKKDYIVKSEIVINAPQNVVFDYLKLLKNQDNFNKWVMTDPDMKKIFTGIDGTVGFIYGWNGNKKAGEGEQEITNVVEGKIIDTEIRFVRPFPSTSYSNLTIELLSENQTKVSWSNTGKMNSPMNAMMTMIEKMLVKDMDTSLNNLKVILEK